MRVEASLNRLMRSILTLADHASMAAECGLNNRDGGIARFVTGMEKTFLLGTEIRGFSNRPTASALNNSWPVQNKALRRGAGVVRPPRPTQRLAPKVVAVQLDRSKRRRRSRRDDGSGCGRSSASRCRALRRAKRISAPAWAIHTNRSKSLTTVYGRIISLSSCERIWQCHT